MKNLFPHIYIGTLIALIILCGACKKENLDGIKQASLNTPFDLQLSEKVLLKTADRQLKLELRSLNDTRCGDVLPCEHTGNATARVLLSDTDHHAEAETNLCIGRCDEETKTSDTVMVNIDGQKYTIILKRIFGSTDKKAELQVNTN
ncbi:MAG TPA: hypothetical protein VGD22_20250 [Sphingobacteriaceae bacterium]